MEYIVKIEKLDNQGRGIAFIDGMITFIPNVLPEETVKIKITKSNKKIKEGMLLEIIEASPKRIKPICKYFGICGGCDLMHMSYEDELEYKENKVKEIIKKFTNLNDDIVKKIIPNEFMEYRNKATFQVKEKIGYYKEKSYDIISIDSCSIIKPKINELLEIVKKIDMEYVYQIVIRVSDNDSMIIFKVNGERDFDISTLKNSFTTIVEFKDTYKVLYGNGYIVDTIGKYSYLISPDSFFQVNNNGALNLYNKVREYVNNSNYLLDLYCGTGTIGIYLSDISKKVLGVEINKNAIKDANKNKEINRIKNIEFICSDVANFNEIDSFDTVVLDPPRSGLDNKTINYLLNLKTPKIVYVSCDPITLARDLKILSEQYEVKEITPVDMFSRTHHVECVALLNLFSKK